MGEIEIVEHFHNPLMPFFFSSVSRHTQPCRVIECLVYGQFHVDDISLGHVPDLTANGIKIAVYVNTIHHHSSICGRAVSGDRINQGRFTSTTLTDNDNEFAWLK